jgi:hypothetical protein
MRAALSIAVGLALVLTLSVGLRAADEEKGGKQTLKGKITCAKCDLNESDKCDTVIVVEKGGKKTVYHFDAKGHKKYHAKICKEPMDGTVMGTVSEKDGKKIVTVTDVKFQ